MLPHELKTLEPSSPQELGGSVSSKDIDEIHLARLGKRPVLKVI
jgi:choline transport protein